MRLNAPFVCVEKTAVCGFTERVVLTGEGYLCQWQSENMATEQHLAFFYKGLQVNELMSSTFFLMETLIITRMWS